MSLGYPSSDRETAEAVAKAVGVAFEPWMQDWPIEVSDGSRVEEFIRHYGGEQNPAARVAIAELIVASLDEAFSAGTPSNEVLERAGCILKTYPHIIEYWSCRDARNEEEMFQITPWIRNL